MGIKNLKYFNNNDFKFFFNLLKSINKKSYSDIKKYQIEKVNKIIKNSFKNVIFYNELYSKNNLNNFQIKEFKDLSKFPIINKEIIINNYDKFQNSSLKKSNLVRMTTGGSTGNPMQVLMTKKYKSYSLASTFFYLHHFKCDPVVDKSVRLHGDIIKKNDGLFEIKKNKLVLSSNHLDFDKVYFFVSLIKKFKPKYLHAYPSAIYLFSKIILDNKIKIDFKIEYIFTDSEVLYSKQKIIIEKVFSCKIISIYGHTEGSVFGLTSNGNENFYIHPYFGIIELVDKNNDVITKPNIKGEIVVTGFLNEAMPLIRYKTGDFAKYSNKNNKYNLFKYKILKSIEGRLQDFMIDKNKKLIPVAPMLFDYNVDWRNIEKFQLIQNQIGKIKILIKKNKINQLDSKINYQKQFQNLFGNNINTTVKFVNEIQNTRIGKFRYFVQNLNIHEFNQ